MICRSAVDEQATSSTVDLSVRWWEICSSSESGGWAFVARGRSGMRGRVQVSKGGGVAENTTRARQRNLLDCCLLIIALFL
jgi:hypothetical protein